MIRSLGNRRDTGRLVRLLPLLAVLLFLAGGAAADPQLEGLILPGFDPLLRFTDDPRLLGAERLVLRERLLSQGVDPVKGEGLPTFESLYRYLLESRLNVDLVREEEEIETSGTLGIETRFRYPKWVLLFQVAHELPGGFVYYPPRDVGIAEMDLFIDDIEISRQRRFAAASLRNRLTMLDRSGGVQRGGEGSLINLTIPIKLPRTLEKIIGRGEKTNIRISGREHISIGGESTTSNRFTANERRQSQSLFPSLDMEQQLQINLSGQIGEKIKIEVDHNSEMIGPDGTKIKLWFEGGEDEIIQSIETGDVGLTLPGSQLLGYSSNKSGLFGIKVVGQVGRADFTVVASKQKSESSSKSFNSTGGSQSEHVILSNQYLNNRFFRLDLPPGLQAAHGFETPDLPGRTVFADRNTPGNQFIDLGSISIYMVQGATTQPQADDVQWVVAIPDHGGRWTQNPGAIPATEVENQTDIGLYPWRNATRPGELWRRIRDFTILADQDNRLVAIDMNRSYGFRDALAVTYRVVDGDGNVLYQVGDVPGVDVNNRVVWSENSDQLYYRMKLLKPENPIDDPHLWQYVLRNIYPLGGANIDASTFTLSLQQTTQVSQPNLDLDANEQGSGLELFRIFGLDRETQLAAPGHDYIPDYHNGLIFDFANGLLKFPLNMPRPFDADSTLYIAYADTESFDFNDSVLKDNRDRRMYRPADSEISLFQNSGTFRFVVSHAAASSSFNLGVSNIEEGSETVTLDGRTLVKDVDYTIDYTFGQIDLKGDAAANLTADSSIGVNYQYAPFLGGGNSSLLGFNLGYELGRESRMSTTWLYESNQVVGHKAKLGEEPSRTLVGNLNGQFMLKPGILTDVANVLSRRDSDRESTVQVNGEVALSVPNPNTFNDAHVEDFEGIDSSDLMPVSRLSWNASSEPAHEEGLEIDPDNPRYEDYSYLQARDYNPENRLETRWFLPHEVTQRRYLNPDLKEQEGREAQQVLQIHMRLAEDQSTWTADSWGGVMRGLGRSGIDLTQTQFLEFWINDFRHELLGDEPTGTLHFDFGNLSEDFYWPEVGGVPQYDTWQREDGIVSGRPDGIFVISADELNEDIGLGGNPGGVDEFHVPPSDQFNANDPYPQINGTAGNNREDSEDLDGDSIHDLREGFFTISIDLADSALVDVLRDYPASEVTDNLNSHRSWRKYRVRLGDMLQVLPSQGTTPSLATVTHMRIWFEDRTPAADQTMRDIQLSEIKFLGSRWERQGVRRIATAADPDERLLEHAERGSDEGFFLGEVNNKENPDYEPPFELYVLNNIPEKESSLVVDFQNLEPGHLVRTSRLVSPRGDDYTRYEKLSWFIHSSSTDQADLDMFFRVGADTLNYYEVSYRFDESRGARTGWKELSLDMAELSNAKLQPRDPDTRWIETTVDDSESGDVYRVRVVGSPDLRRVKRLYFGVRNTDRSTPASGLFWFNDVKLRQVKREKGVAERLAVRVNMADRIKFDLDWSRQDAEFHGLNTSVGQGRTTEDLNLSAGLRLDDFVPLLGFQLPINVGRQRSTQRPKYVTNSDIEIIDDVLRESETSITERDNYSVRLSRQSTSTFAPIRFLIEPWTFSLSGSKANEVSPLLLSNTRNVQGTINYNLQLPQNKTLGDAPIFSWIPILKSAAYLPKRIEFAGNFSQATRNGSSYREQDDVFVVQPTTNTRRGSLSGKIEAKPLPVLDTTVTMRSERDMFRERRIAGFNVGSETIYERQIQLRFSPPSRLGLPDNWIWRPLTAASKGLLKLRPNVTFNGTYRDDHSPSIAVGEDPDGTKNIQNSGDWTVRFTMPLGAAVKRVFPRKVEVNTGDRQRLLRNIENQVRRGQLEDAELLRLVERMGDSALDDRERTRIEDEVVRLARIVEEEGRRPTGGGTAAGDTVIAEESGLDWDAAGTQGGGIRIPNPTGPLLEVLREIQDIQLSYTAKDAGSYNRVMPEISPTFWYQAGLHHDTDIPDDLYTARNENTRTTKSGSTALKFSRWVSMDVKYNQTEGGRTNNGFTTGNKSKDWPDLQFLVSGIERLGLFGGGSDGPLRSANFNVIYKESEMVSGFTATDYSPQTKTQISPRFSLTFRNGMSASLNVNVTRDETDNNGSLSRTGRFMVGTTFKHSFGAERFLSRLGLYKPGNSPKVNMDLDFQFSRDTTQRWQPQDSRDGDPTTETGMTKISVNPRFSYQITRNLSGAMRLIYARDVVRETDTITQRFGLGLEATFTF